MSVAVGAVLFGVALLTRLPFLTEHLYEHDAVLYARAIESFDPAAQRPHPPGYLWYVLLIRAVASVVGDPNRAMTLVSAVAGAAAVALLYALAARMYDERTARVAALFLLTSVTFWARGVVAYPYTLLAALALLVALALWRTIDPGTSVPPSARERRFILAGGIWGIAVGTRPDLALLAPLWLLVAATSGVALRGALLSATAAALAVAAWILASGAATPGGLSAFLGALGQQSDEIERRSSVLGDGVSAAARNVRDLARYLGRGLYALAPFVAVVAISRELRRIEAMDARRLAFLVIWTCAPIPVYVLVHVGEYGHVFTVLPALAILAARGAIGLAAVVALPRAVPWLAGAAVLVNAGIFLLSDSPLSARDIARRDHGIAEKVAWIRAHVDPREAVIVTAFDTVIAEHYLGPEYRLIAHDPEAVPEPEQEPLCVAPAECPRVAVLWDDLFAQSDGWRTVAMPHGARLRVAEVPEGSALRVEDARRPRPPRRP